MAAGYMLGQQGAERLERERLALLERVHDPSTMAALERTGVGAGWRCLDVGAGAGSVTRWLADRVAPGGEVVALDLETRLLDPMRTAAGVSVRRGDIMAGPPELDAYDLVHARLLLLHLPDRAAAVTNLASAARPGGWVVVGDVDFTTLEAVDPPPAWSVVWASFLAAVAQAGWEVACGRSLARRLAAAGLEQVGGAGACESVPGGGVRCELTARTIERLRDRVLAMDGVTAADLDGALAGLRDPGRTFISPTSWNAWGRRPCLVSPGPRPTGTELPG